MNLKFAVLFSLAIVLASAGAPKIGTPVTVDFKPIHNGGGLVYPIAEYDTEQVCNAVGRNSGCSGCELGTKGLCSWVRYDLQVLSDDNWAVEYKCIPTKQADEEEINEESTKVGYMCPADPSKEPIITDRIAIRNAATSLTFSFPPSGSIPGWISPVSNLNLQSLGSDNVDSFLSLEQTSRILSKTYDTELFETDDESDAKVTVDRTSLWGEAGFARTSGYDQLARWNVNCDEIASRETFDMTRLAGADDLECVASERMRYCFEVHLAAYYSSRCPLYGVAVSGICESSFKKTIQNCGFIDQNAFRAVNDAKGPVFDRLNTFLIDVVTDDTPYCQEMAPLSPSGEVLHLAGLDRPVGEDCKW